LCLWKLNENGSSLFYRQFLFQHSCLAFFKVKLFCNLSVTIRLTVITLLQSRNRFPLSRYSAWEKSFCSISCNQRLPFRDTKVLLLKKALYPKSWPLFFRKKKPTPARNIKLFHFMGIYLEWILQPLQAHVSSQLMPKN